MFYVVYGKMFFLIDSFLSSRRLNYLKVRVISFFFYFNCPLDDVLWKIAI